MVTGVQKRLLNKYQSNLDKVDLAALIEAGGDGGSSTALLNNAWFVDLRANTNGNGSAGSPFNTIAAANAVSQQFDKIYISGTVAAGGLPAVTSFPVREGRNYEFLTMAFMACRPTIIPDATIPANSFTNIKAEYFIIDGDSISGVDPFITINCPTFLIFETSILTAASSTLAYSAFFGTTADAAGGGIILQNSRVFFDDRPVYIYYNRFDNVDFTAINSQIDVGEACIVNNRADSDVNFKNCILRNDSDDDIVLPTLKIDGGTYLNIVQSRVVNGGTAYALSILGAGDYCQMDNNCWFESNGVTSIFRSVAATFTVCACSEQQIDLNGDNTQILPAFSSVVTTSTAAPDLALYAPLSGQICSGGSPSHLYMYTGAAWAQIS